MADGDRQAEIGAEKEKELTVMSERGGGRRRWAGGGDRRWMIGGGYRPRSGEGMLAADIAVNPKI